MGILKYRYSRNSEFETEVVDGAGPKDSYLVRPCERYNELLWSCRSLRGRLHQYYVYGELFDCSDIKENYLGCLKYRKTKNVECLEPIILWEKNLIDTRMNASLNSPVWQLRDTPPKDFNAPLPDFIKQRQNWSSFSRARKDSEI